MTDLKDLATSADIRPDFSKSINSNEKKALVELMNHEFVSQRVAFDQQVRAKQAETLEKHKKESGFERLIKNIDTAKEEYEVLEESNTKAFRAFKENQDLTFEKLRNERGAFEKKQDDALELLQNKRTRAVETLRNKGFKPSGDLIQVTGYSSESVSRDVKKKVQGIEQELEDIREAIYPAENQKNKYTALLWATSTMGEAMVIIRDVLGNGVIPEIKKSDLPYNNKQITQQ